MNKRQIELLKLALKQKEQEQKMTKEIRNNPNKFREYVIKDDRTGLSIHQEDLHYFWMTHIKHCKVINKHCAIIAPWGHGKSVQIAIAEALQLIGQNQQIRIKIVNSLDEYAMDRVKVIKNYIENDENYKKIYPEVIKDDKNQQWTDHRLYVQREGRSIDPTIDARGMLSKGVGTRADVIIFDDPLDESSMTSESIRKRTRDQYNNGWMPRLVDDGFVYYIATRWHEDDLTKTIIESGRYSVLIQGISEDYNYIESEIIE